MLTEPLDAFFADFGRMALIDGTPVIVLFNDVRTPLEVSGEFFETAQLSVAAKTSDVATVTRGDSVRILGTIAEHDGLALAEQLAALQALTAEELAALTGDDYTISAQPDELDGLTLMPLMEA